MVVVVVVVEAVDDGGVVVVVVVAAAVVVLALTPEAKGVVDGVTVDKGVVTVAVVGRRCLVVKTCSDRIWLRFNLPFGVLVVVVVVVVVEVGVGVVVVVVGVEEPKMEEEEERWIKGRLVLWSIVILRVVVWSPGLPRRLVVGVVLLFDGLGVVEVVEVVMDVWGVVVVVAFEVRVGVEVEFWERPKLWVKSNPTVRLFITTGCNITLLFDPEPEEGVGVVIGVGVAEEPWTSVEGVVWFIFNPVERGSLVVVVVEGVWVGDVESWFVFLGRLAVDDGVVVVVVVVEEGDEEERLEKNVRIFLIREGRRGWFEFSVFSDVPVVGPSVFEEPDGGTEGLAVVVAVVAVVVAAVVVVAVVAVAVVVPWRFGVGGVVVVVEERDGGAGVVGVDVAADVDVRVEGTEGVKGWPPWPAAAKLVIWETRRWRIKSSWW